jgi:chromosome segregation ATPase
MEVVMEDQILRVDKEQEALSDVDVARKLRKKEQRLSARVEEAQEAVARAQDRFQRVEVRLRRREARLERLTSHLMLVQKQIVDLQTTHQQPEHVEPIPTTPVTSEPTLISDSEESASAQSEPEASAPSTTESAASTTIEPEVVAIPEPEAIAPTDSTTVAVSTTTEPEAIATSTTESDTSAIIEPEPVASPDSTTVDIPTTTEPEASASSTTEPATSTTLEPEVDATPGIDTSSDSTMGGEPTKSLRSEQETQPIAGLLPQDIQSAKEAWVAAESAMQNARNTAHGIAASISFLSQTGEFSDEFMAELVRKQAEANKALLKAQDAARVAYERFVQAQKGAEQVASQVSMNTSDGHSQQMQENGALPSFEDNGSDQTARLHAIRLYKQ